MQTHHQPEEEQHTVPSPSAVKETLLPRDTSADAETADVVCASVTNLLAVAEQQKHRRKQLAFFGICIAVQVALIAAFPQSLIAILSYACTVFLVAFLGGSFALRYRATTRALAQIDDVRMVGPLIERLHAGRKGLRTRRLVRQALIRLLPRLKASDAALLTTGQKGAMARHLAHLALFQRDKEFQLAILRALEQVGDAQALPVVESIVQRQPHWAGQSQVHEAALECLPFLRQRVTEETARQTLLRGTGPGAGSGNHLLRPAEGVTEEKPDELLRADLSQPALPPQTDMESQ